MADYHGTSFKQADERLGKRDSLNIGWHTTLERRPDGSIAVKYHQTDVVTYLPNGRVRLESGGWRTMTTKSRMCEYAPVSMHSERGIWYISPRNKWPEYPKIQWGDPGHDEAYKAYSEAVDKSYAPYEDGMEIGPRGGVYGAGSSKDVDEELKQRKRINAFARKYGVALVKGEIPKPGPGDCWCCLMFDAESNRAEPNNFNSYEHSRSRQGLQPQRDNDHLWSHIDEEYFVPSLLVNALESLGFGDAYKAQAWYHMTGDDKYQWFARWGLDETGGMFANAIRRYLLRRLGFSDAGPGIKKVKVA